MPKIPMFIKRLEEIITEVSALYERRHQIKARLYDGELYFKKDLSKKEFLAGVETFNGLVRELEEVDIDIRDLHTEYAIIMEEKSTGIRASVLLKPHTTATGKAMAARKLPLGETEVEAEDLWFLQLSKKLFGVSPEDVEIDRNK